jgi:hypothetical protein
MNPKHRRALVAAAALVVALPASSESILDKVKRLDELRQAQQRAQQQSAQHLQALPQGVPGATPPGFTRSPDALRELLARGEVTGDELVVEIKAIRNALRRNRNEAGLAATTGGAATGGGGGLDLSKLLKEVALKELEGKAKELAGRLQLTSLDGSLGGLTSEPALLAQFSIKLPSPDGMSPQLMQRTVTLAAMIVAAHVTRGIYERAQRDLAGIEDDYKALIDRREKAAALLYEAVTARAQAQRDGSAGALREADASLLRTLSPDEKAFLEADLSRLDAANFVNDIAAQNLAIRYLRLRDPEAYKDYSARRDGTLKRTRAYVLTAAGAAAVGGLAALFVREVRYVAQSAPTKQLFVLLPLLGKFVSESMPLVKLALQTTAGTFSTAMSTPRFRVTTAGGELRVQDAAEVFGAIKDKAAERLFAESLFRTGAPGLVQRVHTCDRAEAGRMLDAVVQRKEREQFAQAWFGSNMASDNFQFVNAFAPLPVDDDTAEEIRQVSGRIGELGDRLLRADYRGQRDETVMPLGALQERVAAGATKWNNEQLMRLIFANREGAASTATLQLGDVSVRPLPSPESIFVYENLIDACKSLVAPAAPPPAAPGASRPPAKPPRKT